MWRKLVSFFRWLVGCLFGQSASAELVAQTQPGLGEPIKLAAEPMTDCCRTASPIVRDGRRHPNKVLVPTRAGDRRVAKVVGCAGATVTCRRLHQQRRFQATLLAV